MFTFKKIVVCLQCSWVVVVAWRQNHAIMEHGEKASTKSGSGGAWQRKTYMFCLDENVEVKCDGPDQMMQVTSAYYNRNEKAMSERQCQPPDSKWKSCNVNAKKMVDAQCKDTSSCYLIPSDHAVCDAEAFQQMRLVIKCRTAGEGEEVVTQPPRPGVELGTTPPPKSPLDKDVANSEADKIETAVKEQFKDPNLKEVAYMPCYRSLTVENVLEGDIESDSWRAQLSSSVTNCGENDGCFHLTFPDGLVYNDPDAEPTSEELVKGELKEVGENMWVTYQGVGLKNVDYGIGLQRSDYGSWGICLPKTKTLQYAVEAWNTWRASFNTGG